ncbi:TetR family transcriptional regulator [Paenibacillus vini]|uniref:TetR family transcriptional regulator n=1 Tax=Paenibacillus vini TaxID=1476024 RepID=UPI0025B6F754|nr:TetR family transcriptional regulator [Paenibacillus vini]MDN4068749.1 TetR family transcriptional regulator [Paenibacillus vini]
MSVRTQVLKSAEELVKSKPFDQITFAEIAKMAGVHWTAVRRHFGDKQGLRSWLAERQSDNNGTLADTRTRILEAAAKVFAEQGYATASLEKAAAEAGMTKGAVYWHFSSKQDLFLAIMERNLIQQNRQLPVQIENLLEADDPESALYAWLKSQFDCLEAGDGGPQLFLEFITSSREPEVRDKLQAMFGQSLEALGGFLAQMQQKGYIAQGLDPQSLGIMVDALMKGIVIEWLIDPVSCQLEPLLQTAAKVLWRGLAPGK